MPGELVILDVVGPDVYLAGLQNQRQPVVALDILESYLPVLDTVTDDIDDHEDEQQQAAAQQIPHPCRFVHILPLGIEPLVLQGLYLVVGIESGISLVELVEQLLVVRHELILTVRHVHRRQLKVVDMVAVYQPFQRKGIPHNLTLALGADALDSLADVLVGQRIGAPSVFQH